MEKGKLPRHEKKATEIDENTPISDVKAPNILERAKEEIDALVQTIHTRRERHSHSDDTNSSPSDKVGKRPSFIKKAKEETGEFMHFKRSALLHKESHGRSEGLDENTAIEEVKGPSVFARAKEEIEAILQTLNPKPSGKELSGGAVSSPNEKEGLRKNLGRGLEKVCSSLAHKKDT